jgi:hypothetical protein
MSGPESAPDLDALQQVIDRSTRSATASVADSVAYPGRQMSASEFVEFFERVRLLAMATVGAAGRPHIAPVHARLSGKAMRLVVYDNTIRRIDIRSNPRVAFSTWDDKGAAVIIYGSAHEVPGTIRPAKPGSSGKPRNVVEIEVRLTRVYAMRAPRRPS